MWRPPKRYIFRTKRNARKKRPFFFDAKRCYNPHVLKFNAISSSSLPSFFFMVIDTHHMWFLPGGRVIALIDMQADKKEAAILRCRVIDL